MGLRQQFLNHVAQTSESPLMLEIEKAEGVFLFGPNNKKYFDLISGVSVSNVGHGNPKVIEAIKNQVDSYTHLMVYGEIVQKPQVELAVKLKSLLPDTLDSTYFVNSGSEAIEGAIKLAKRYTGRSGMVAFINAYHGSSIGALSVMGCEEQKRSYRPLMPGVTHINFNNFDDLSLITEETAGVIIEPIQGEGGIRIAQYDYLQELRKRCNEVGALLIFDEVQTGLGRTGKMFALEHYNVVPDILVLAKALGGGMPLGAFIASKNVMSSFCTDPVLGHITTFGGHPVSCAASLAAIKVLEDEHLIEAVNRKEQIFRKALEGHKLVKEIRSKGLIMAIELGSADKVNAILRLGLERGFLLDYFLFCDSAFRIAPPLTITDEECEVASQLLLDGLDTIAK
ncbi:MAG: aspartate aminotransferase family protein [Bacteroidales bacterium]|nr:aspartate aminotransferase family protein [Bacteroidales bacterium]HPD96463.1 aspartate aminotransferase family protein [Tenuifilaceae bacterium]HRX30729.1 aspartate aminotransferase family protein [Tenuifilaceae bacterium]